MTDLFIDCSGNESPTPTLTLSKKEEYHFVFQSGKRHYLRVKNIMAPK